MLQIFPISDDPNRFLPTLFPLCFPAVLLAILASKPLLDGCCQSPALPQVWHFLRCHKSLLRVLCDLHSLYFWIEVSWVISANIVSGGTCQFKNFGNLTFYLDHLRVLIPPLVISLQQFNYLYGLSRQLGAVQYTGKRGFQVCSSCLECAYRLLSTFCFSAYFQTNACLVLQRLWPTFEFGLERADGADNRA